MPTRKSATERARHVSFLRPEDEGAFSPEINRVGYYIFTGTGLNYAKDKLQDQGIFFTQPNKVFYAPNVGGAYAFAKSRSAQFNDTPVILFVESTNRSINIRGNGDVRNDIVSDPIPKETIIHAYDVSDITLGDLQGLDPDDQYFLLLNKGKPVEI